MICHVPTAAGAVRLEIPPIGKSIPQSTRVSRIGDVGVEQKAGENVFVVSRSVLGIRGGRRGL